MFLHSCCENIDTKYLKSEIFISMPNMSLLSHFPSIPVLIFPQSVIFKLICMQKWMTPNFYFKNQFYIDEILFMLILLAKISQIYNGSWL